MKLKKLLIATLFVIPFLGIISCSNGNQSKGNSDNMVYIDSIESENRQLNFFIDQLSLSMDSIIDQEGNIIRLGSKDYAGSTNQQQIKDDVKIFSEILARQHDKVAQLRDSIKNLTGENASKMERIVAYYEAQIAAKEAIIAQLQKDLEDKNFSIKNLEQNVAYLNTNITELTEQNEIQEEALKVQDEMINEAYVFIGTKKELEKEGLLESGGFLRKKKLSIENLKADHFNKVDIRYFTEVSIPGKNPKILTTMPQGSYKLERVDKNNYILKITNPTSFWSVSNFLIIQYN